MVEPKRLTYQCIKGDTDKYGICHASIIVNDVHSDSNFFYTGSISAPEEIVDNLISYIDGLETNFYLKVELGLDVENEFTAGGQTFRTSCHTECPGLDGYPSMLCSHCPIYCCTPDSDGICLVDPKRYRKDWAKEWRRWFNNGMQGHPTLIA